MLQHTATASMRLVMTTATLLLTPIVCSVPQRTRIVGDTQSTVVCEDQDCKSPERSQSLLQTKKSSPTPSCTLPENGEWVEVRLTGASPFEMAVRKGALISDSLKEKGYWEVQDTSIWGSPGQALDIGGNIGYYTFALAQSGWQVTTFEPMQHNIGFIKATLCKNPALAAKVNLVEVGLGTQNQECDVIEILNNVGNGMVRCNGDNNGGGSPWTPWDFAGSHVAGTFKIRRLDEVLKERKIDTIDFIKLDVEGYECEALKGAGAENFLKQYHPRLIKSEVWQTQERCIAWDYLTIFENAGYRIGKDDDPACTGPAFTGAEKYGGGNFYMCKGK